jgi:hypothetical protein
MITIAEVEKNYNIEFDDVKNKRMKLSTWFKRQGLKNTGTALNVIEKLYILNKLKK